jgi:predicted nucleic acid-binding protein
LIVVDASIVAQYLLTAALRPDLKELFATQDVLAAPSLIEFEIGAVLRRHNLLGVVSDERAQQCFELLSSLRLEFHDARLFATEIWKLRKNFTYYDASYVALADALKIPLYTTDKKFVEMANHGANIVCV